MTDSMATFIFPPRTSSSALSPGSSPAGSGSQRSTFSPLLQQHPVHHDHHALSPSDDDAENPDLDDDSSSMDGEEHAHAVVQAVRQSRPSRARLLSVHELQARARDSDLLLYLNGPLDLPPLPARPLSPSSTAAMSDARTAATSPVPYPSSRITPPDASSSRSEAPPLPLDNAEEPGSADDKQVEQEQNSAPQLTAPPVPISAGTTGLGLHTDSLPTSESTRASSSAPDNLRPPSSYSALDVLAGSAMGPVSSTPSPPISAPSPWRPSRQSLLDAALDIYDQDSQDIPSSPPQHSSPPSANEYVEHEAWWRTEPSSDRDESDSDARDPITDTDDERNEGGDQRGPMLPMHLHVLDDPFGMAPLPSLRNATPGPLILPSTEGLSPNHTPGQTPPLAQRPLSQPRTPASPTLTLPAEHVEELTGQEDPSVSASGSGSAEHLPSPHLGPPLSPNGGYFSSVHMKAQPGSNTTSPGEDRTEKRMALLRAELVDAETKLEAAQVANDTDSVIKLEEKAAGFRKALLAHHSAAMSRQLARLPTPASQPRPSIASTAEPLDPEPATEPKSTPATTSGPSDRAVPQAQHPNNSLIAAAAAALGQGQHSSDRSNTSAPDGISFAAAMQIIALRAGSMESELEAARKRAEHHANMVEQHRIERESLQQRVQEWQAKHHAHLTTADQTKVQHQEVLDQLKAEHDSRVQELEAALIRVQEDSEQRAQEERIKWEQVLADVQAQTEQRTTELQSQLDDALTRHTELEEQHATALSERDEWATKHADLYQAHETLQVQLGRAYQDRDTVREEYASLNTKHEHLQGTHDDAVRSRDAVQAQHTLLDTEHGTLQATLAELSEQKEESDRSIQELNTQLESANQERDNLRSDLAQRTHECEALQAHATQLKAEQQAAEQAKVELRSHLDQAQVSLTSKDERLTELEQQLAAQPDRTAEVEAEQAEAEATKQKLQSQLTEAKEALAFQDARVAELEQQDDATPKALPEPTALAPVPNEPSSCALDVPEPSVSVSTESESTSRAREPAGHFSPLVAAEKPMPEPPSFGSVPSDSSDLLPSSDSRPRGVGLAQSYYDSFDQAPDQQPVGRSAHIASLPEADHQPTLPQAIARAEVAEYAEAESHTALQVAETQLASLTTRLEQAVQCAIDAEQRASSPGAMVDDIAPEAMEQRGTAPESTALRTQLVQAHAQVEAAQAEAKTAKAELHNARQAFTQPDELELKAARVASDQAGTVTSMGESSDLPELATLQAQNEPLQPDLTQAQQQLTRQVSSGGLDTPDGWQVVTSELSSSPQIIAKDVGSTASAKRALATDLPEQATPTESMERELPVSSTVPVPAPETSGISQDSHALQLRAELAEGKLEELRRAHRELLDKHHTARTEALEATMTLAAAKQAAQKLQEDYDAAQEEAASGVNKLHHLAEVEAQLRAAQRKADEAVEDLTLATEQHESQRTDLENKLAELQPQLEQAEQDNSELRAFKAHADDVGASQRQERDEAISRADSAERGLRQLELAVAAERRILAEREGLFSAFERRLESAEARLGEEDRRCAQMLGKVDGREEMDNLLLQIKGVVPPNQRETAGQNIDSLISSLSEHITDAFDELERRGCRVHRVPGESRSLYGSGEDEDVDTDVDLWEKSSDTARIGNNKPDINVAMARRLDEVLATVSRYEHELAEHAKASKATDAELKSLETERVAMEEATSQLRQALDVARQESQEHAVEVTILGARLAKAQAGSIDAQGDRSRDLGEMTNLSALQTKASTLQRTVSSLEQELGASRTRVAELETRLVSALRSRKTGSTGTQQDEHLELPGLATRLDEAERTALEAQHAQAELSAEASVLRVGCDRLAAERTRLLAALEAASAKQPPAIVTDQESMEMLAPEPHAEQRSRWSVSDGSPSEYHLGDGEGEAGLSHRTLAPMSPSSTQPSTREVTGEAVASPAQLATLREEHSLLRVQFDSLREQYTRLRTEHEQIRDEAASLRVELQSAKAGRVAAEVTPKDLSSPVAEAPHGSEIAELIALFPRATSHGVAASESSVTPSMAATTDLSPLPSLRRLADTWPSPAKRSHTPAGITVSTASSTGSGKVDVSSLRSRFEQQSTNPSSPVADRNTPLSTPGQFGASLPTSTTPISHAGSTPPVPHPRPPSSASGRTSKHNTPLNWNRVVSDVKEMRSTIVALRSQVSSAQQEKLRVESVLASLRHLLDKSFVGGESRPDTPNEGDVSFAHVNETLGLTDRAPGQEMPSPILSYTSNPTGSSTRSQLWTSRRNTPPCASSSTPTGSLIQSRTTTRPDRQRSGGRKPLKLQPVSPVQRIFEPSLTGETNDVPPVPSLPVGLGLQGRQSSMSRPSSRTSLGSVKSQPAAGHASKPSSMRTMTLGMDGTQLSRRVRDLDDTVMTLEAEKRQATSQIRALQDALSEAYSELHSRSDTSGLKLAGCLTSTPPGDHISSESSPLRTGGLAPPSAHACQSGSTTPTLSTMQRLNSSDSDNSSRKVQAHGPPLTTDASSDTVSPTSE